MLGVGEIFLILDATGTCKTGKSIESCSNWRLVLRHVLQAPLYGV